jgi:hypothetical protein
VGIIGVKDEKDLKVHSSQRAAVDLNKVDCMDDMDINGPLTTDNR